MTDDERREVAAALRAYLAHPAPWHLSDAVGYALDEKGDYDKVARLADLIEPSDASRGRRDSVAGGSGRNRDTNQDTVPIESPAVQKAPECDREPLIALSKGMLDAFRVGAVSGEGIDRVWCRELHNEYARRIREACGEVAE